MEESLNWPIFALIGLMFILQLFITVNLLDGQKERGALNKEIEKINKELLRTRDRYHDMETGIRKAQMMAGLVEEKLKDLGHK